MYKMRYMGNTLTSFKASAILHHSKVIYHTKVFYGEMG